MLFPDVLEHVPGRPLWQVAHVLSPVGGALLARTGHARRVGAAHGDVLSYSKRKVSENNRGVQGNFF